MIPSSYFKSIGIAFLVLSLNSIYAQSEKISANRSDSSINDHSELSKESNLPELKYEFGDVTIDLKIETERLKKLYEKEIQKNKIHLKNTSQTEILKSLDSIRINSENLYINGNYKESRRSYKKGFEILNQFYKAQSDSYKEKFKEYNQIVNQTKDKLNEVNSENTNNRLETIIKKQKEAMLYNYLAKNHEASGRLNQSYNYFKLANKELLQTLMILGKELATYNSNKEKSENENDSKYLLLDYLSPIGRKDWDDIVGVDHIMEENKRETERKRIQRYLSNKVKEETKQAQPDSKQESKSTEDSLKSQQQ
ncbi:MAG: hypothetical protein O9346_01565 [Leptospiraceae bacterium]|nr:hypothetical protein [Leptospiraceae bacterium]